MSRFIGAPSLLYSAAFMPLSLMAANTQAPGRLLPDGRLEIKPTLITPVTGATATAFLNAGGDIEDAPMYIKMSSSKYQANVPVGIRERTFMDEDENELNRKWSEWKDSNHEHMTAEDGDKIVPGNSWGVELSSAELKVLLGLTGYTLYLAHEVNALLPEPEAV